MGSYHGLAGIKGGEAKGPFVKPTPKAFINALKKAKACSTASDEGAITVWRDDAGLYHCDRSRYMRTRAEGVFHSTDEVRVWLLRELPEIECAAVDSSATPKGKDNG